MQMAIPARWQRTRNIGGNIFVEMQFGSLRAKPQPGMPLDHLKTRTPGNNPKLIRIDAAWAKNRSETLLDRRRRNQKHQTNRERGCENQPAPPAPHKIKSSGG